MTTTIRSHRLRKIGGMRDLVLPLPIRTIDSKVSINSRQRILRTASYVTGGIKRRTHSLHIDELQREAGIVRFKVADDGLEFVDFLARDTHFLVHDLGLDLNP